VKLDKPRLLPAASYWQDVKPMILMGSTKGKRPVIKLSKGAKGFDDPSKPKIAIRIWAQTRVTAPGKDEPEWGKEKGSISFNHIFNGIDIDIRGHSGAIGIRHSGSQGSSLLNSTIFAEGAYSGMSNCCGQRGGTYNIEVIGGEHGIVIDTDSRFPILISCIFRGQTKDAISYSNSAIGISFSGSGDSIELPTMVVGCLFKPDSTVAVDMTTSDSYGGIMMIDCIFELKNGGIVALTKKKENIFIENSYVRGADSVYSNGPKITASGKWTLIEQFSSNTEQGVNLINGTESTGDIFTNKQVSSVPSYETIHNRHYSRIPTFEDNDALNVKSYGAKGDGTTDDTEAFRKAIAASDKVFVPKGNFRLSGTLELGPRTHIFGLTRAFTTIGDGTSSDSTGGDSFSLTTIDDANAAPGLSYIAVSGGIDWKSGNGTCMLMSGFLNFSGNGGGRFYAVSFESKGQQRGQQVIFDGIKLPTSIYALDIEGKRVNPQSEIKNCSHIRIYYFKVEAATLGLSGTVGNTPGRISDSSDIKIYCMYGNVLDLGDRAMLDIVNSSKVMVCQVGTLKPGNFPRVRETWKDKKNEIPSTKSCGLFIRD